MEKNGGQFVSPYSIHKDSWYHVNSPTAVITYKLPEFEYEIRTNSLGLRDIEHPISKPPGELRLVAIGDSFTEGWGARFEQTWLNQLGRTLNAEHTATPLRMICGGAAGSDPFYGYRILVDKLLAYRPDFVILVVNNSDIMDVILRGGMERFRPDGTTQGVDSPAMPWLFDSSQFVRFILFKLFDYTHHLITRSERDRKAQQALEKIMRLVLEYNTQLESQGVDFSLVILPFRGELKRNQYQKLHRLKQFAMDHEIEVIDTMPYLYEKLVEHKHRVDDLYWPIDTHFTELGYRYVAEAIEVGISPKIAGAQAMGIR